MRHRLAGRHLGRDTAHRMSLYRNLVTDLLRYERITTTEAKAKEIRPMAEKIITLARKGDLHARRQAQRFVFDPRVVKKTFDEIGPRMKDRPGGYLRITSLEPRKGDGARMAAIELVDYVDAPPTPRPQRVTAAPATAATPAAATSAAAAEDESVVAVDEETHDSLDVADRMIDKRDVVETETEEPADEVESSDEEPPEAIPSDELAPDASEAQLESEQQALQDTAEEAEERDSEPGSQAPGAGPVR